MKKLAGIICGGLIFGMLITNGRAEEIRYGFETINAVRVSEGEANAVYSPEGYSEAGCVAIGEIRTRTARVKIGEQFAVNPGSSYLVSLEAKPVNLLRCHGYLAVDWYDASGALVERELSRPIYTAAKRPHTWKEMTEPVWMSFEIAKKAPERATTGQVFINLINNASLSSEGRQARSSGLILVDDVLVTRTPFVKISSDEPGNLFVEGTPFALRVTISDIPEELAGLTASGGLYDLWGKEIFYDSQYIENDIIEEPVTIPDLKRGYYEIRLKLTSEGKEIRSMRVPAGVVPDPAVRTAGERDPFALDAGFSWAYYQEGEEILKEAAGVAKRAGLRSLRDRMSFGEVNPSPDEFKWGRYLRSAQIQHDAGIEVLQIIHDLPGWLSSEADGNREAPPKTLTGIYNFFKNAANDLGTFVPFWESWNEADIFFFGGRPEEFAGVQKAAFLGAIAGNPGVTVTSNSFCTPFQWWTEMTYRNGVKDYFDVLNLHFYGNGEERDVFERLADHKKNTALFGVNQPWWMTEMGTTCFWDSSGSFTRSEIQQAQKLVKAFIYNISEGCARYFYFYMADYFERNHDLWGIVHEDLTPKPALVALANMTGILDEAAYRGKYDLGITGSTAYVFNNGREDVLVAWAEAEGASGLSGSALVARSMVGTPVPPENIDPYPVFITGAELREDRFIQRPAEQAEYLRPEIAPLSLVQMIRGIPANDYKVGVSRRKQAVEIESGVPLPVELVLCNFWNGPITVSSRWECPEGWRLDAEKNGSTTLGPYEERIIRVTAVPANVEKEKQYEISVTSTAPGRKIAPVVMGMRGKDSNE